MKAGAEQTDRISRSLHGRFMSLTSHRMRSMMDTDSNGLILVRRTMAVNLSVVNMSAKHKADVKHNWFTQDTISSDVIAGTVLPVNTWQEKRNGN